jgi:hypothetical protein
MTKKKYILFVLFVLTISSFYFYRYIKLECIFPTNEEIIYIVKSYISNLVINNARYGKIINLENQIQIDFKSLKIEKVSDTEEILSVKFSFDNGCNVTNNFIALINRCGNIETSSERLHDCKS